MADMFFGKGQFLTRKRKNLFMGNGSSNNYDYGKGVRQLLTEVEAVTLGSTLNVTGNTVIGGTSTSTGITNNGNYTGGGNLIIDGGITANSEFSTTYAGLITPGVEVLLGAIVGANFNVTTDQGVNMQRIGTQKYIITKILVTNASISLTTAAGGFYTAASKGGVTIVAASQAYSALTASTTVLNTTLAVNRTYTTDPVYLSLTTAQGAAATADVYIFGIILP